MMICTRGILHKLFEVSVHLHTCNTIPFSTHVELLDVRSPALAGFDHGNLHDLNGRGSGPMPRSHITVCGHNTEREAQ